MECEKRLRRVSFVRGKRSRSRLTQAEAQVRQLRRGRFHRGEGTASALSC